MIRLPQLPWPAAETVRGLCADHEGPVEVMQYLPNNTRLFTSDQMHDYATKSYLVALNEAATFLENHGYKGFGMDAFVCADAVRSLKNETP